jgi:hypothetical protein
MAQYFNHDICRRSNQAEKPRNKQHMIAGLFEIIVRKITLPPKFQNLKNSKHQKPFTFDFFKSPNLPHPTSYTKIQIPEKKSVQQRENSHAMLQRAKTSF